MYTLKNEKGSIMLSKNVIGTIIVNSVNRFKGKVILCSPKGKAGYSEKMNMNFFDLEIKDDEMYIKIYVLIKFGTSINANTNAIIDAVNGQIKTLFGSAPKSTSVIIKGVFSKNIAKRNIEVKK